LSIRGIIPTVLEAISGISAGLSPIPKTSSFTKSGSPDHGWLNPSLKQQSRIQCMTTKAALPSMMRISRDGGGRSGRSILTRIGANGVTGMISTWLSLIFPLPQRPNFWLRRITPPCPSSTILPATASDGSSVGKKLWTAEALFPSTRFGSTARGVSSRKKPSRRTPMSMKAASPLETILSLVGPGRFRPRIRPGTGVDGVPRGAFSGRPRPPQG